jgi:hypothetical protein
MPETARSQESVAFVDKPANDVDLFIDDDAQTNNRMDLLGGL